MNNPRVGDRLQRWTTPLLAPLSIVYGGVIAARNAWYDRSRSAQTLANIPVISVGNITTGGVGKTPLVIGVALRLIEFGEKPAILTRGYGAARGEAPDEALEMRERIPDAPVVINPDRRAGVRQAIDEHSATCVLLDDGFQHRRLARDLDLVVIDALRPWGGGRMLPAGRLREPLTSLRRADAFILSRVNQASSAAVKSVAHVVRQFAPDRPILRAEVSPRGVTRLNGDHEPLESLAYHTLLPVCGIGNPETFLCSVHEHAGQVCPPLIFRDHQRYTVKEAARIVAAAKKNGANWVITTRKDWVKLAPLWRNDESLAKLPLVRLDVTMTLGEDAERLDALLLDMLEARRGIRPQARV